MSFSLGNFHLKIMRSFHFSIFIKTRHAQFLAPGRAEVKKILVISFGLVGGPNKPLVDQIRDFAGFDLFQMS